LGGPKKGIYSVPKKGVPPAGSSKESKDSAPPPGGEETHSCERPSLEKKSGFSPPKTGKAAQNKERNKGAFVKKPPLSVKGLENPPP